MEPKKEKDKIKPKFRSQIISKREFLYGRGATDHNGCSRDDDGSGGGGVGKINRAKTRSKTPSNRGAF